MTTTNADKPFTRGERVEYCGDHFVVVDNFGTTGRVREAYEGGSTIYPFYWDFQGELVRRAQN